MYSSDEDDPGAKLETSKEELETRKAVADAQFGDLLHIGVFMVLDYLFFRIQNNFILLFLDMIVFKLN